jgi:hypothetical protein
MTIRQRVIGGIVSALWVGILWGAMITAAQAGGDTVQLANGKSLLSGAVQPGAPQAGRPLYSPPMFMDRGTPVSERPFAKPFVDRAPSMSERPLAPIGGGSQLAPGQVPFIWCQGQWVRLDNPWHSCPSR